MSSAAKKGVYVHPNSFYFFADDIGSHRQSISIYNPLEVVIKYKILSTAPKRYLVDEPEGYIEPKSVMELTIRHQKSSFSENIKDKLRIQIYNRQLVLIYKKDLPLDSIVSREDFMVSSNFKDSDTVPDLGEYSTSFAHGNNLNSMMNANINNLSSKSRNLESRNQMVTNNTESSVNYLVIIIGLICLTLIFLPSIGTKDSSIPVYMHMTFEAKMFASFVLGMVTMVILKS